MTAPGAAIAEGDDPRVALVTGGARGIGAASARALAAAGLRVLVLDAGALDPVPEDLAAAGVATAADVAALRAAADDDGWGDHLAVVGGDVRDPAALERACAEAVARWGRLDVLVAAAAVLHGGVPQWEASTDHLETMWQVDVLGIWHACAAAVPRMLAGPDPSGCRVVAVASAAGGRGLFHLSGYTVVKHAVVGLVRGLAADLVGTGVTAVAVAPGPTETAMLRRTAATYDVEVAALTDTTLLRDALDPAEVAAVVALCCARAGRVLNGSVLSADGGVA